MRNKFFFGAVGFFLVCLFVLFASGVVRAAVLVHGEQVQMAVVVNNVQVGEDVQVGEVQVGDVQVGDVQVSDVQVGEDVQVGDVQVGEAVATS